jgi:hypothetical protein
MSLTSAGDLCRLALVVGDVVVMSVMDVELCLRETWYATKVWNTPCEVQIFTYRRHLYTIQPPLFAFFFVINHQHNSTRYSSNHRKDNRALLRRARCPGSFEQVQANSRLRALHLSHKRHPPIKRHYTHSELGINSTDGSRLSDNPQSLSITSLNSIQSLLYHQTAYDLSKYQL